MNCYSKPYNKKLADIMLGMFYLLEDKEEKSCLIFELLEISVKFAV